LNLKKEVRGPVLSILEDVFGDEVNPKKASKYTEVIFLAGIGGGKSFTSSVVISYLTYWIACLKNPQAFFNLAPDTRIALMNMSTSGPHAMDVVFGEVKARIDNSPWFKNKFPYDPEVKTRLAFPKNIYILPGNSQETTFEGYNIFGGVIDEADSHKKTEDKDYAEVGYNAIKRRITSRFFNRGLLVIIGSPKSVYGFLVTKYHMAENKARTYRVWKATWELFDETTFGKERFQYKGLSIPMEYKEDFDESPELALRDLAARPSFAVEPFFSKSDALNDKEVISGLDPFEGYKFVLPNSQFELANWFVGDDKNPRYVHVDLGIDRERGDKCGFAMGKILGYTDFRRDINEEEKPIVQIELLLRIESIEGGEIQISDIRKFIYYLIENRGFNIVKVTYDGFQSTESIQQLKNKGINAGILSVDKDTTAYEDLREAIYDGRAKYYLYHPFLLEAQQLEIIDGKRVDHPVKGSKDVTDAVAGVFESLITGDTTPTRTRKWKPRYGPKRIRTLVENYGQR
jgi:hypothetical protein